MKRWTVFVSVVALLALYTGLQFGLLAPSAPLAAVWAADVAFFWALIGWQLSHRSGAASRSRVVSALGWLVAAAVAAGLSALGLRQALAGPMLREVTVPIAGLAPAFEGLRVVQLSDLHVGPMIGARYLNDVVDRVLALKPDLIALTGDVADGTVAQLEEPIAPLARLKAPLGTYYVTGNHEYYWGAEPWIRKVASFGLIPLIDDSRVIERDGARLLVGGVADSAAPRFISTHRSDPRLAAGSGDADLKILLAHRPDACVEAEPAGFALQLSGHTHGGQFFPFSVIVGLVHRYRRGLYRHGRLWVYVSSGTGYWGPPHRFAVPAEITLLRLVRA